MDVYSKLSKKLTKSVFKLILFFMLSGCTSLSLINAVPEIESPAMQGNNDRIGFELSGIGGKELIVFQDPSKRPLVFNTNNLKTSAAFFTRTGISWYPNNNIAISGGLQNSSAMYLKGKLNIFGSYREDPALGLFYLSVNFESTFQQAKKSGDNNGVTGASGFPWEGSSQNISGTAGVSIGYQVFKRVLPFLGLNFQQFQTTGNVKQSVSTTGDPGGSYDLGVVAGTTQIIGLGVEFRPKYRFYITPLVQYFDFNWGGNKIQDVTGSIRITYVPL